MARDLQKMLKTSKGLELRKLDRDIQKSLLIKNDKLVMNNIHTQLESKFELVPSEGKRDDCPIRPINEIKKSIINEVSQFLQDNNFEEASKAIDAEYEL